MGIAKEFREFAFKGDVLEITVAVIIGGAFAGIVNSMIKDVIMPIVAIPGKVDFTNQYFGLTEKVRAAIAADPNLTLEAARAVGPTLAYGSFVTIFINFIILAICIFIVVKAFNTARKRFEADQLAPPPAGPTTDQKLLTEIRDLLAKR